MDASLNLEGRHPFCFRLDSAVIVIVNILGNRLGEGLKWDAIDFENKKISIQHTVVTAKVNGTVTEIARDKTKTKSSCRTLPLISACEQMLNNWVTVTSTQQATFIHIWISPVRYLRRMQSSISSQKTPKYKKWAKKKNSLKSFDPKPFYDEVPMVGLEPTWFPERF